MISRIFYYNSQEFVKNEIKSKKKFPTYEDEFSDIVNTIFRLQGIFKVDAFDLANGNLSKKYPTRMLNGMYCLFIYILFKI